MHADPERTGWRESSLPAARHHRTLPRIVPRQPPSHQWSSLLVTLWRSMKCTKMILIILHQQLSHIISTSLSGNLNFNISEYKVTRLDFCSSSFSSFDDCVCGVYPYFNDVSYGRLGCNAYIYHPFDDVIFATNEVVLRVRTCFARRGSYVVLNTISIDTNMREIDPIGRDCSGDEFSELGHTLVGVRGKKGYCLDRFDVHYSRCSSV